MRWIFLHLKSEWFAAGIDIQISETPERESIYIQDIFGAHERSDPPSGKQAGVLPFSGTIVLEKGNKLAVDLTAYTF